MKRTFTKYPEKYVRASTRDMCTYRVNVKADTPVLLSATLTVQAPCGLDADGLMYDYVIDEIERQLQVVNIVDDKEDFRLSKDEIDYFDSAWGFHGGVPEEEYDEDLAKEGYYDDYYDEPQYSGYKYNLTWTITYNFNGVEFQNEVEDDAWKDESDIIEYSKECIADNFEIVDFSVV